MSYEWIKETSGFIFRRKSFNRKPEACAFRLSKPTDRRKRWRTDWRSVPKQIRRFTASRAPTAGWPVGVLAGILWIPGKAVACGLPFDEDDIGANTDLISAATLREARTSPYARRSQE